MPHVMMAHDTDPVDLLQQKVGNLDDVEIFHNKLLVAIYKRPEKTKSNLYLPETHLDEDRFQSKVGLVLKMGPSAFVSSAAWNFANIMTGEWVVFKPSDGWSISVNQVDCRMLEDIDVRGRIRFPDQVW